MANFSIRTVVGAGATVANAFAGSAFEFLGRNARVTIASTTIAAAATANDITATIQYGAEVQLEEGAIHSEASIDRGPLMPEDIVVDDVGAAGDRLVMRITNTGGAARNVRTKVRIIPL